MSDKVSIIIPTRNRKDWLRQALQSARGQTWPDKELIVVDEASSDSTLAMLADEFPDVRVVKHEAARGPSAARNSGVAAACGDWILFLDDDDLLYREHIELLVRESKGVPPGTVVSGRWRRFTLMADKVRLGPIVCAPADRRGLDSLAEILEPMGEGTICGHSLLWPRSLIAKVPWDERLTSNGDSDFFGRTILAGAKIVGRPVGMAYYRVHQGERVSFAFAMRRPLLAAQYRLKWSQMLLSHPEHEIFAPAMRNGFMTLLITLSGLPEASALVPILKDAYWLWGGKGYFVANPPRNPLKRLVAAGVLQLSGPSGLHWLLKQASQPSRILESQLSGYYDPRTDGDRADASTIRSFG